MSEFWYYAQGNETRGPIAFDQLTKLLSQLPSPRGILVWREGFDDWKAAENVREIVEKLVRPPPLPRSPVTARTETVTVPAPKDAVTDEHGPVTVGGYHQQFGTIRPELPSDQKANKRGRIAFLIVFMIVLLVGAYFTNQVYGNSPSGIANVIGQLFGTWFLLTLLTWWLRKSPYTAAVVLAVSAFSVGLSNIGKLQEAWDSKAALQAMSGTKRLDKALRQNPDNKTLKLFAMASKIAEETAAATAKLSDEIEPTGLAKDINFATATRNDLEALRRDLKTAETNTTSYIPRYLALLKDERDKIEVSAPSLNVARTTVISFLEGLDKGRVKNLTFNSNMMQARSEAYRAYGNYVEFLIGEYGNYNVDTNGQFSFPKQATADKFNMLAGTMNAALQRVAALEVERKQLEQSRQEGREQLVKGK
jgi:hypothetical protein